MRSITNSVFVFKVSRGTNKRAWFGEYPNSFLGWIEIFFILKYRTFLKTNTGYIFPELIVLKKYSYVVTAPADCFVTELTRFPSDPSVIRSVVVLFSIRSLCIADPDINTSICTSPSGLIESEVGKFNVNINLNSVFSTVSIP